MPKQNETERDNPEREYKAYLKIKKIKTSFTVLALVAFEGVDRDITGRCPSLNDLLTI